MKPILKNASDYLLLVAGVALIVLSLSSLTQPTHAQSSTCNMNPPRQCIYDVLESYCEHVGACSTPTCSCVDVFFGHPGCCYVEIGTIVEGYPCMAQGCTTFKKCCLGSCHN
jgi:hypothetical protein